MFNPFDGALFATSWATSTTYAVIAGNSPVVAAIAAAAVTGIFMLIGKGIELYVRARRDRRVHDLERKLRDLQPKR